MRVAATIVGTLATLLGLMMAVPRLVTGWIYLDSGQGSLALIGAVLFLLPPLLAVVALASGWHRPKTGAAWLVVATAASALLLWPDLTALLVTSTFLLTALVLTLLRGASQAAN